MESLYLKLYNLENYLLTDVRDNFLTNGFLSPFDFFCIIIWKANRAKSKIYQRLIDKNPNLSECVKTLTNEIYTATVDKQKLKILIVKYGFRLPMASAILSILYPDNFTIYDVRVCETFPNFKGIDDLVFDRLWEKYRDYIISVKEYGKQDISLRDKDRIIWGKSFYDQLTADLESNFKR